MFGKTLIGLLAQVIFLFGVCAPVFATHQLASLPSSYTRPDPAASGGIVGRIGVTQRTPMAVVAVLRSDPTKIYLGKIEDRTTFRFEGLPVGRYDLTLIYRDIIYEGFELAREDTLTDRDREQIKTHIRAGNPFFETKHFHRIEGTAGTGNFARVLLEEMHVRPEGEIRSVKLVVLMRVGEVGWQTTASREIVRTHRAAPGYTIDDLRRERPMPERPMRGAGLLNHSHLSSLSGVRVVDSERDMGTIR